MKQIGLYPNPTKGVVSFKVPKLKEGYYELTLMNALGQVVLHKQLDDNSYQELDLQQYRSGLYLVKIVSEKVVYQQKLYLAK